MHNETRLWTKEISRTPLFGLDTRLAVGPIVIASDTPKLMVVILRCVIKQVMYASLLPEIRQSHEEAGLTQSDAVTLTVMTRAVPPTRL